MRDNLQYQNQVVQDQPMDLEYFQSILVKLDADCA